MERQTFQICVVMLCLLLLLTGIMPAFADETDAYIDNRSTAELVVVSYFNAINRHEYVRAYSYWDTAGGISPQLPPFPQFEQGYANTESVQLTLGTVTSDAGAGQIFFSVPATLVAHTTSGATQTFVGCYTLHLSQPSFQAAPPFRPLGITSAQVQQVANNANTAALMAKACSGQGAGQPEPTPDSTLDPAAIDASRYLDDRSDPVQVLRSLFNAVNRHEYVRAYSYWETAPAFPQFEQGYSETDSVQLVTGDVVSDLGAGQLNYSVPATLTAKTTGGVTQTFVGCYQLHLSQPAIQGTPPFRPLGIVSAKAQQVANDANTAVLMQKACS